MKFKEYLITIIITILIIGLFGLNYFANKFVLRADNIYRVYLDGKIIGYTESDKQLFSLIDKKQQKIKEKYNVSKVYPPESLEVVKSNSYNVELSSSEEIYNKISKLDSFTIEGYIVSVKDKDKIKERINVLDKKIFDESILDFVHAFVDEEKYNAFMNDTQEEIDTTGKIIERMYFDETLTIKKGYIDVKEDIYTKEEDLTQYLLFGKDRDIQKYTVQQGDTIETVSEANKLNPNEFLVANPKYTSKESLLKIGDEVNITLIDPVITFSYEVQEVSDSEVPFERKVVYDDTKSGTYNEVTTPGVTGITRITSRYVVKNGEMQSGVAIDKSASKVIVEKVDEITTRGSQYVAPTPTPYQGNAGSGSYVDTGDTWGWPTNSPYMITSNFGWRWGTIHDGVDISGTGYGSPIYAALDGTVIDAGSGGLGGWQAGYQVTIQHDNGYCTLYGHMVPDSILVSKGQRVSRGQRIGSMGETGLAFGVHLHFALFKGIPYKGGTALNPLVLWQ